MPAMTESDAPPLRSIPSGDPRRLVLADLAYPGWRATVDGRSADVLTVDGLFRGVVVPAGAHEVELRYRPLSVRVGALLSLLAVCVMMPYARSCARVHAGGARGAR